MQASKASVTRRTFFSASGLGAIAALRGPSLSAAQAQALIGVSVSPDVEKANVRVVDEFCAAFARGDLAKATSLNYMDRGTDFRVLKTVVLGPLVLNERDDIFPKGLSDSNTGPTTIRVAAGLFFVEDGKIVEWTDYVIRK
jgi:limonene-1,2-epoxide hydrolase